MKINKVCAEVKKRKAYLIDFFILFILIMFSALWDNDAFGLYLDSVNPDYLAVQLLHPNNINPNMLLPHVGVPLLGQLYHGTVTMFVQYIALLFVRQPSITLLRVLNGIYAFCSCMMIYLILKKLNIKRNIIMFSEICLTTSISLFTIMKVQFYIKLPGTALILLAILILLYGTEKEKQYRYILFAGIFAGLAFYSYFIYLFFMPMFLYCVYILFEKKDAIYNFFCYIGGYIVGATGYFIGYFALITKIIINDKVEIKEQQIILGNRLLAIFCCVFMLMEIIYLYNTYRKSWFRGIIGKISSILFALTILIISVLLGKILIKNDGIIIEWFHNSLDDLNVKGEKIGVIGRIIQLGGYLYSIFGNLVENNIFGVTVSKFRIFYLGLYILEILVAVCCCIVSKNVREKYITIIKIYCGFVISFFVCAIFFASRMGVQHFVPIYISSFFMFAVAIQVVYEVVVCIKNKKRVFVGGMVCVAVLCLGVNSVNAMSMHRQLNMVGCEGLYTNQINKVALEAMQNKKEGSREMYVFPEWGMLSGFEYLTNNEIYCIEDYNLDMLKWYYDNSYSLKICYFNSENENKYRSILEKINSKNIKLKEKTDQQGVPQLYVLSVEAEKKDVYLDSGFYEDGWMSEEGVFEVGKAGKRVFIEYYAPPEMEGVTLSVLNEKGKVVAEDVLSEGIRQMSFDMDQNSFKYIIKVSKYINPLRDGTGEDGRDLSVVLREVTVE